MKTHVKTPSRKVLRSLCAEVGPDDGLDPREKARSRHGAMARSRSDRKLRQLCGQVAQTLNLVLSGSSDEVLSGLYVSAVDPAPNSGRLMVTVSAGPAGPTDPAEVLGHLDHAAGRLRAEVASAVSRRKVPHLVYQLALPLSGIPPRA